jgi:S-DNA-T family DNA segregation ATPase FtsK/SpoIIIE
MNLLAKNNEMIQEAKARNKEDPSKTTHEHLTEIEKREFNNRNYVGKGRQDPLYQEAIDTVKKEQRASISMLQRKLKVSYTRCNEMVIAMQEDGVVSDFQSNMTRSVLVK